MKKGIVLPLLLLTCSIGFAQTNTNQQVEMYIVPQVFTVELSHDTMVPPKRRGVVRLGDEAVFGLQYGRMFGRHFLVKAGIGFSTREYSLNKYSAGDIIGDLFSFDSPPQTKDSFPFAFIHYKLKYFDLPFTIAYEKANRHSVVQFHYGLMARFQFLNESRAVITLDSAAASLTSPHNVVQAEKSYANDINSFVVSVQPYADLSFGIYKGLGLYLRFSPFSLYASSLNKRISISQEEMMGCGIGISYHF